MHREAKIGLQIYVCLEEDPFLLANLELKGCNVYFSLERSPVAFPHYYSSYPGGVYWIKNISYRCTKELIQFIVFFTSCFLVSCAIPSITEEIMYSAHIIITLVHTKGRAQKIYTYVYIFSQPYILCLASVEKVCFLPITVTSEPLKEREKEVKRHGPSQTHTSYIFVFRQKRSEEVNRMTKIKASLLSFSLSLLWCIKKRVKKPESL